ncbi:MAG: hypothetical protein ABSB84_07410 [Verrucomicrobiota bacterium]|jgi:hypothetical protein
MAEWHMAIPKKLTRAEVYKQIDAFRGIVNRSPGDKPSAEQWVAAKRVETDLPPKSAKPATDEEI